MVEITTENLHDIDFDKGQGLVPVIVEHFEHKDTLMLGYMNAGAVIETLNSGKVTFYSRSKNRLWTKGETSENYLWFKQMYMDCDRDTLLVKAEPAGPVCHTGTSTCFDLPIASENFNLSTLESIILDRKQNPKEGSYTNKLLAKGVNKVAQKVGEEAVELVIEAKDDNKELFLGEAADLLYHYTVLLAHKGISLSEVYDVLAKRHAKKK